MFLNKFSQTVIVVGLILSTFSLGAQTQITWSQVRKIQFGNEMIYKMGRTDSLLDGKYKIATGTGGFSEVGFVEGKVDGTWTEYDSFGNKSFHSNFKNGIGQGESIGFFQNGNIQTEEFFKDGKPHGTWKEYNEEGRVIKIEKYKNGKKEGKWMMEFFRPQDHSTKIETKHYKDDQPTGHWKAKTEEGKLLWEIKYKGPKEYVKKTYHPNGRMETYENYADDKRSGHYERYASNGIKVREANYKDGFLFGTVKEFEPKKGKVKSELTYKNDKKDGPARLYNQANALSEEGKFHNNRKQGVWKYYDLAGNLEREVIYEEGGVVSEKIYN